MKTRGLFSADSWNQSSLHTPDFTYTYLESMTSTAFDFHFSALLEFDWSREPDLSGLFWWRIRRKHSNWRDI